MDPRIIALYDEYTHAPLPRRVFLERLAVLAGGSAAASALLPMLDNNYAVAAVVAPEDPRIRTGTVRIDLPGGTMAAYLAVPADGPERRGGVVVIHENRGLNPHIRDIARRLAVSGFTALAVDMLHPQGGTPADEDRAREMFTRVDRAAAVRDLVAVVEWMRTRPDANGKVGVVGFCWGGAMANLLAVASPTLVAAVPFYGAAPPSSDVAKIRANLLIHYAANDPRVNATWPDYDAALKAARVDHRAYFYDGTEHGFNNDPAGARYHAAAADLAWKRTLAFFEANLT
ncbi:MAG TPA: dienelactone hydrolase family protein [Casimicrobiaceae bacterium]|mgnify:CR=1 FL=1|nr:dienelactone hydrolase family protein [Casimicrobiaceae bacterium]